MSVLAESVDVVIGVDTHRDTLAAAAVTAIGAVTAHTQASADTRGYRALLDFSRTHAPGSRCWAIEGAGGYGAGLAAFLTEQGERWSRSAGPSGHHGPALVRATRSTRCAQPGRP